MRWCEPGCSLLLFEEPSRFRGLQEKKHIAPADEGQTTNRSHLFLNPNGTPRSHLSAYIQYHPTEVFRDKYINARVFACFIARTVWYDSNIGPARVAAEKLL